ncbi:molybdopterin biosynthesis protein MoeB [Palaeococcus pacificus DY20341]|uniref:Molybdopterin biosynthesis protein MoeB n=1 Tax=Palaeococcus pacificus DY20341 TaxID=1343739 RepID=A0A075LVK4_9EURY|nr:ThiF family adenylyltransferase [Palaeococcus pacificus]AIF70161.1 molybdopterin biosynthesis protein MoeB [Palaeococcus pacificus DY20341]
MEVFSRHFPIIGLEGQRKLSKAKVAVVGAGALGSWEVYFLKKLGVGEIIVIDRDFVDYNDLPRTIYEEGDVDKPKVDVLKEKFGVKGYFEDLNPSTVHLLDEADLIIDGTDNIYTRQVINDYCVKNNKPWIYVGVLSTYGNVMPIIPGKTACFRCFMPKLPSRPMPTCAVAGIMSYVPSLAASIAVALAAKILLGEEVKSEMIFFDTKTFDFEKIDIPRRDDCDACVRYNFVFLEKQMKIERMCDGSIQITPPEKMNISLDELAKRLDSLGKEYIKTSQFIQFEDDYAEILIFKSGRMIVRGAEDEKEAKNFFARYLGG